MDKCCASKGWIALSYNYYYFGKIKLGLKLLNIKYMI